LVSLQTLHVAEIKAAS